MRDRERERERERDRDRDRQTERERDKQRETDKEEERDRERERETPHPLLRFLKMFLKFKSVIMPYFLKIVLLHVFWIILIVLLVTVDKDASAGKQLNAFGFFTGR